MALVIAVWMSAGALVIPFLNLFFHRVHGLSIERVGGLFALSQLMGAAVLFCNGELSARLGPVRVLTGWVILFGPLLWWLGNAEALGLAIVLFLLQSVVPPATNALIDQVLMERAPVERRGAVSSWRNAATEGSGLAGASAGGRLIERGSYDLLLGVAGAVALLGCTLLALAFRWLPRVDSAKTNPPAEHPVEPLLVSGSDRAT
jgi:predicted MFS family arabinose efflux permease